MRRPRRRGRRSRELRRSANWKLVAAARNRRRMPAAPPVTPQALAKMRNTSAKARVTRAKYDPRNPARKLSAPITAPANAPARHGGRGSRPGIHAVALLQQRRDIGARPEEGGVAEGELPTVAAQQVPTLARERHDQRTGHEVEHGIRTGEREHGGDGQDERAGGGGVPHARAPNNPVGRSSSTRMNRRKIPAWPRLSPKNRPERLSTAPTAQAAQQGAGDRSHAAQHDHGEGDEHEALPGPRVDVE